MCISKCAFPGDTDAAAGLGTNFENCFRTPKSVDVNQVYVSRGTDINIGPEALQDLTGTHHPTPLQARKGQGSPRPTGGTVPHPGTGAGHQCCIIISPWLIKCSLSLRKRVQEMGLCWVQKYTAERKQGRSFFSTRLNGKVNCRFMAEMIDANTCPHSASSFSLKGSKNHLQLTNYLVSGH